MSDLIVSVLSTETISIPVTVTSGATAFDPTGDAVRIAFIPSTANPGSGDWVAAQWRGVPGVLGKSWLAVIDIGPGGAKTLTYGRYYVWVTFTTGGSASPVRCVGTIQIV